LDPLVQLVIQELLALLVLELQDLPELLDRQEEQELLALVLEQLDQQELLDRQELLVLVLATLAQLEQQALLVLLVIPELLELQVQQVLQALV
jgi:hypothetical protein